MILLFAALLFQTRKVEFTYVPEKALHRVNLAGTFNNWNKDATPLVLKQDEKTWSVALELPPGKHYYKFVLDGETWVTDPKAAKNEDDGNGNVNSVLLVAPDGYEKPAAKGDGTITFAAVSHPREIPALNWDRGALYLSVRTRAGDVQTVTVDVQGAARVPARHVAMTESSRDEFVSNWVAKVPWDRKQAIRYSFSLDDGGRGPLTLDASGPWYSRKGGEKAFVLDPKAFKPFLPPTWVEKSVIYQIFPDRFANGDPSNDPKGVVAWGAKPEYFNWFGGDVAGVEEHLPYLKELGVGCVYFNPVFEGPSNHRYETTDYEKIDHRFGTNKEFADLTEHMDKLGMKVVLDGVFNHTAVDFFPFADILKRQRESNYLDWYFVKSFPVTVKENPPYEAWWNFPSLPKLNYGNPSVVKEMLSVPEYWSKRAKVAGWRLDAANEVTSDYWKLFRDKVKSLDSQNWIVGEIWGDGSPWLKGDQFDSVMNYQFRGSVLGFVAQGKTTPTQFWNSLMKTYDSYGPQVSRNMMNILGSHDTPRILNECGKNAQLARLAAMVQFTWVGAPCVYYGDELGMEGEKDPDNRRGMAWGRAKGENPYLDLYRNLSRLRAGTPALQSGDPSLISADDPRKFLVFRRQLGDQWAVVAVNRSDQPRTLGLQTSERLLKLNSIENNPASVGQVKSELRPTNGHISMTVSPFSVSVVSTVSRTGGS